MINIRIVGEKNAMRLISRNKTILSSISVSSISALFCVNSVKNTSYNYGPQF